MDLLASLNPAQEDAVTAPDGPVLVVAGAGTGKTRVLTTRIAWLLEQRRARPAEVIAFTFTNKAAREMRDRVDGLVGHGRAPFWIGTFHATGLKILRADGAAVGVERGFGIYDGDDQQRVIKRVQKDLGIDPKQFPPATARAAISRWKNDDTAPEAAAAAASTWVDERHAAIYAGYEQALRQANALDFDDLILRTVHLLEQDRAVLEKYAGRFRHVLVDEFQDTNPLQLVLVKALSSVHRNVFAVGDDDQAIYSWRGACVENMLRFEEYFQGAHLYRLEQNYRSTGNVLAAANAVIAHNKRRKGKNLWTGDGAGDLLRQEMSADAEDEAARVVEIVREEQRAGRTRGDVTVLYRTNAQSRLVEDALRRAALPHQVVGSLQFYDRREVRDLLAYLKLVDNPRDLVALQRVINVPRRRIGTTTVERLVEVAQREDLSPGEAAAQPGLLETTLGPAACTRVRAFLDQAARWRAAAREQPVSRVLERIIAEVDYAGFLEEDDPATARARAENVAELVNAAHAFVEGSAGVVLSASDGLRPDGDGMSSDRVPGDPDAAADLDGPAPGSVAAFLEQVALISDADTIGEGEGVVRLMTIHTAKGLEFPVVVLAGCEDDLLPHATSSMEADGVEEERRLFYVAITRARSRLYLLHAGRRRRFGAYEDTLPSRFLLEIPDELVERVGLPGSASPSMGDLLFGGGVAGGAAAGRAGGGATGGWRPGWRPGDDMPARRTAPPRRVAPEDWVKPRRQRGGAGAGSPARGSGWRDEVSQESAFYEGQLVSHTAFGAGVVTRVEGSGDDLALTVEFREHGRKHILPRFAPLTPLD
ncbi:MAG: UvrD-helicase domain-containing protein [Candidatus Krumholzibacteriia bacterium]